MLLPRPRRSQDFATFVAGRVGRRARLARGERQAARGGDNGSAFFSRLPFPAKSAMAEILVSDWCDNRPRIAGASGPSPPNALRRRTSFWQPPEEKVKNPIPCKSPVDRLY